MLDHDHSMWVCAVAAPAAAHIEEHPVASATIILSPNNCVTSLAYGVSPQPANAPKYVIMIVQIDFL